MKTEFQTIGGVCAITYGSYSKTNVENVLKIENRVFFESENTENENKIKTLTTELKETAKQKLSKLNINFNYEKYNHLLEEIKTILQQKVSKKVIEEYSGEILTWIEKGLQLHIGKDICIFCGNRISNERGSFLQDLFNEEYKNFIKQIDVLSQSLTLFDIETILSTFDSYVENKIEGEETIRDCNLLILQLKNEIKLLQNLLSEKKQNIDNTNFTIKTIDNLAMNISNKLEIFNSYIYKHNNQTDSFDKFQKKKLKILRHNFYTSKQRQKIIFLCLMI